MLRLLTACTRAHVRTACNYHNSLLYLRQQLRPPLCRYISEEQLSAGSDQVAELFERAIGQRTNRRDNAAPDIRTMRREALSLYRQIWRYSNLFVWKDQHGRPWRDVIRASARAEFVDARFETDPELINKLIITGHDAVQRSVDAFMKKRQQLQDEEDANAAGSGL